MLSSMPPGFFKPACLAALLLVSTGCTKNDDDDGHDPHLSGPCAAFQPPGVSHSGSPAIGGSVTLLASSGLPDIEYEWTGPGGFTSTKMQPVITGIQYSQSGVYSARITGLGCVSAYRGTTVTVKTPCATMDVNTAAVSGNTWYFYSNIHCGPLGTNQYHGVTATSSSGVLYIQFNHSAAPSGYGVYGISQLPGIDTTLVSMRLIESGTEFNAIAGAFYVGKPGSQTTFTFCGTTFKSATSLSRTVTAFLRCN